MHWTDLFWLGLGIGLGWSWRGRSPKVIPAALPSHPLSSAEENQPFLQPLQLAYQLATEMNQFKGGFLARTSHELRSPLNGIIGMQQLILSDLCDGPEEEREFITQANQSALKMIAVLDRVVEVARLQHGTMSLKTQPMPLASLLQTVHDLTYLQAADRNLQLKVALPDPDLYVLADPQRLKQVLLYLVDTPIAQMQEGSIEMSVGVAVETGYAQIWIDSDWTDGGSFPLSEPIDLLHTPAANSNIPSPGLNLLTSQMLIALMQGTLTVLNVPLMSDANGSQHQRLRLQCSMPLVVPEPE